MQVAPLEWAFALSHPQAGADAFQWATPGSQRNILFERGPSIKAAALTPELRRLMNDRQWLKSG